MFAKISTAVGEGKRIHVGCSQISTTDFDVMNEADVWLYTKQTRADNWDSSDDFAFFVDAMASTQHCFRGTMQSNETWKGYLSVDTDFA